MTRCLLALVISVWSQAEHGTVLGRPDWGGGCPPSSLCLSVAWWLSFLRHLALACLERDKAPVST